MHNYQRVTADAPDKEDLDFGELQIADYVVFLLALDTYMRWMEETARPESDPVFARGMLLLRSVERQHLSRIDEFLRAGITNPGSLRMLENALRLPPTPRGASVRALRLRTILSKGGVQTAKHVFGTSTRARREVLDAISASMLEEAKEAFGKFSVIMMKDKRLQQWIDRAQMVTSEAVSSINEAPLVAPNAVHEAAKQVGEGADELKAAQVTGDAAAPASPAHAEAQQKQSDVLLDVEQKATAAAANSLSKAGLPDTPPTRSEVVGIATAAALAAAKDPTDIQNVPAAFVNAGYPLDPEQMDAAMTSGKVLVAASAGSGKSTTVVSRIAYLVDNQKVLPSRIMAMTFNKKAATELQEKIQKKLGADRGKAVMCDTMHTVFRKFIIGDTKSGIPAFGTPEEQRMMTEDLIAPSQKGRAPSKVKPGDISRTISTLWKSCSPEHLALHTGWPVDLFKEGPPKAKKAGLFINKWAGNDVSLAQAKAGAHRNQEKLAALYYEFYLGLKGDLPGWQTPCGQKTVDTFMGKYRRGGERLGDMDDMLKVFRDILRRDPKAKATIQGMYDNVIVDEAQDSNTIQHQAIEMLTDHVEPKDPKKSVWLVGDPAQCVSTDTLVTTPSGSCRAGDLQPGVEVLAYRNGRVVSQRVAHVLPSTWSHGIKLTTESGKTLTVSPNHKIWASPPELQDGQKIVYLMFRTDLGFRVGITNKGEALQNPFGGRTLSEGAERLWILAVEGDVESALFTESYYSLKYGIPQCVFNGTRRGINQDRLNRVFKEFGHNGGRLLEGMNLSFDLPNWVATSMTAGSVTRRTIQMVAHGSSGTVVSLEWTGDDLKEVLESTHYTHLPDNRHRLRKWFTNYRQALAFAEELQSKTGANLRRRISTLEEPFPLIVAAGLIPSMSVLVQEGDAITSEKILSVERVPGQFVDLDIDDASNFFGGGVLSHNSIYQFRGAKPELFTDLHGKPGWQTKTIRTNYRCAPEIVETANKLLGERVIPMTAVANPAKPRGEASIQLHETVDNAEAAIGTIHDILTDIESDPKKYRPEDYAVLARTNRELNDFETACILNEIPYMRRGGNGFLDAPESKAVLGYIDLATGTNFEKKQKSFVDALMKPDRGLFLGPDKVETAVHEALDDVARYERKDIRAIDPEILLTDRGYARKLAEYLKAPYKNQLTSKGPWLWNKVCDGLTRQILDMGRDVSDIRKITQDPLAKTEDLLAAILDNVKGTVTNWDPVARREVTVTQSVRENISTYLQLSGDADDDEADTDEEAKPEVDAEGRPIVEKKENPGKGLGAVQFLYALAEPNANDHQQGVLPDMAAGFTKKIERYAQLAEGLRVDPKKWEESQAKITDPKLRQAKPPAVNLATIHSCKGLEWPNVTVLMPAGIFPFVVKPKAGEEPPTEEETQEHNVSELNLAYVALTRAVKNLTVVSIPDRKTHAPSPYIAQAGLVEGENVNKPAGQTPIKTASEDPTLLEGQWHIAQEPDLSFSYDRRSL